MQQQHKTQAIQCVGGLQWLEQAGVFQHQSPGAAIAKDVGQLLDRGLATAHGIGRPKAHQALIDRQPARTIFSELGHHIAAADALGRQASRHLANPLMQRLEAEALRRRTMGGFYSCERPVPLSQQRPKAINPSQPRPIRLLLQGPLILAITLPAHQSVSHRSPAS